MTCSVFLLASPALAGPPLVPPAMIAACKGQSQGSPCAVTLGERTMKGACAPLLDRTLACLPPKRGSKAAPKPQR